MKIQVQTIEGEPRQEIELGFRFIEEAEKGNQAVHDVVVGYMASQRSGTACAKKRGEVSGSGKKPWRQKGTGRARVGSVRSPIWRGGGVVFGPRPRDFQKTVNKKTKDLAMRKALSERIKANEVIVVEHLALEQPRTKDLLKILDQLNVDGTVLIVTKEPNQPIILSARNIPYVATTTTHSLNTYDILKYDRVVFSQEAFSGLGDRLS